LVGRRNQTKEPTDRETTKESSKVGEVQSEESKREEVQLIRRINRGRSAINQKNQ